MEPLYNWAWLRAFEASQVYFWEFHLPAARSKSLWFVFHLKQISSIFAFRGDLVQDVRQSTKESNGIATVLLLSLAMRFSAFRSRLRKFILGISASGSPFQILMICLPFEADFKHFSFPRRPGAARSQKHVRKLWKRNGATTELRYEICSISLQASAFFNAKSAGRSKHFNIYNESKHFVRSMLNFRCEISISLEAFACSASH